MPESADKAQSDELRAKFEGVLSAGRMQGLTEEQVKSQIFAVSYFLRQTTRDFDTAYLLEELTEEFLKADRKTCLLSPAHPHYYADVELAKVMSIEDAKANMIKLLLALSQEPQGPDRLS